ncbi:MAG: phosphodiesterase [Leptothrix sp. (in: Bacteria)]|jgi:Icc protein|nr:phosphodiesterase [Leptothrix sp. (in: b-proteobacteria)]
MLIAQFSDIHIKPEGRLAYGRVDTYALLEAAIDHLAAQPQRPDLLLLTGDLVDVGAPEEYRRLRGLLDRTGLPLLLVPGNHDDREELRQAFPEHPGVEPQGFWQFCRHESRWPGRIIGLDTVVAGESGGRLCAQRLAWLSRTLSEDPGVPTLLMMHHPPFVTGIGHMDEIGLEGREAFAALLEVHPQVQLVTCGHLHRNIRATVGGRAVMTAPSTAHAVQLDIAANAPALFRLEPPGYLLHWWTGEGVVTHHVHGVAAPGPYPFFDEGGRLLL